MNFDWAVTDNTHAKKEPWEREYFSGYITAIQRAARRSLPKRPNNELRGLLGLKLLPADLEAASAKQVQFANVINRDQSVIETATRPPDTRAYKNSTADRIKSYIRCEPGSGEDCSKREKTIFGFAIYFAVIIFLLLIIVTILASTLSASGDGESSNKNNNVVLPTSKLPNKNTFIPSTTVTAPQTKPRKTKKTTANPTQSSSRMTTLTKNSKTVSITTPTSMKTSTKNLKTITTSTSVKVSPSSTSKSAVTSSQPFTTTTTPTAVSPTNQTVVSTASSTPPSSSVESVTNSTIPLSSTTAQTTISQSSSVKNVTSSTTALTSTTTQESTSSSSSTNATQSTTTFDPSPLPLIEKQSVTCTSRVCEFANKTFSRVNFEISPCLDFYEFACGKWIEERRDEIINDTKRNIPKSVQEESRQTLLSQIQVLLEEQYDKDDILAAKVSKRLYQSCMESNLNGNSVIGEVARAKYLKEVHTFLDWMGMEENTTINNTLNNLLKGVNTLFEVTPFFKMSIIHIKNNKNITVYGVKIEPPTMYLPSSVYSAPYETNDVANEYIDASTRILYSYLTSFGFGDDILKRRKRFIRTVRQVHQDTQFITNSEFGKVYQRVLASYLIEANISKIIDKTTSNELSSNIIEVTFSDLDIRYPNLNWSSAIGVISNTAPIQIEHPDYFQQLNDILPTFSEGDLMLHVFMAVIVQRVWAYMPMPFRSTLKNIGYNGDIVYTEFDCVEKALALVREEIHALYIGRYASNVLSNRLTLTGLENAISSSFQKLVSSSSWMKAGLRKATKAIAKSLKVSFSSIKSTIRDSFGIQGANQTFVSLALELHKQVFKEKMAKVASNITDDLDVDWTGTNVYYDAVLNAIGIPTGVTVYFSANEPLFDLHASIGSLISKEIIKILTGELRGGIVPFGWSTTNIAAFDQVASCFGNQLTPLQQSQYDIGNVIIENGAFELIGEVYSSTSTTRDQSIEGTSVTKKMIFLINTAQLHCEISSSQELLKQRINNIIMNSGQLREVFSCPSQSPLVTSDTCSLFQN